MISLNMMMMIPIKQYQGVYAVRNQHNEIKMIRGAFGCIIMSNRILKEGVTQR